MNNREIKVGDTIYFATSFVDHDEPEEYWLIIKDKVKEITPKYYILENSRLLPSKVFLSLVELINDLRNYLKKTYGYKWKEEFIEKVIKNAIKRSF